MKKTLLLLVWGILLALPAYSQGQWQLKTPASNPTLSESNEYSFVFVDENRNEAALICRNGECTPKSINKLYLRTFKGIFWFNGLYREKIRIEVYQEGKLEKKWKVKAKCNTFGDNLTIPVGKRFRKKLMDSNVNIHIVAERYEEVPFEMTLPNLPSSAFTQLQ